MADFNQQLFASGQMPGALGAHGGGADGKKSSVPILTALGLKDARGWVESFNAPGFFSNGGTSGIGGMFAPKSGDKFIQAFQNTGNGEASGLAR